MTDCAELLALVEKLADSEASAAEKLAAEAHLERCPSCRSHVEFLASLNAESRSLPFPEPPESYWEHLPRKVLARVDSEDRRPSGISRILLAPSILRWGALGATLVLVTALGVTMLREGLKAPAPAAPAPAPAAQARESEAPMRMEPISPSMARDEAAPATAGAEALPDSTKSEPASEDSQAPPPGAPPEDVAFRESNEDVLPSLQPAAPASRENAPVLESARARARSTVSPAAVPPAALEDCDGLRRTVASLGSRGEGPDRSDARFRLALCSLERHQREATEELRTIAIEDAEAFLADESHGSRAEEIRGKLRGIKLD